ncbi:hemin uptake protein HemP [Dechloromonas denitrificans]|uniref:hemin uptake protein HemP n=1 Tax=Dechloromonas denitrificans TaxID=281362 RepID=UPI001CF8F8E0|nr:hemin uptake protein HemP [Dechloromonas denitrificans]
MQTTKQMLRAPFLGRQNSGIKAAHASDADNAHYSPQGPVIHVSTGIAKTYTSHELFGSCNELAIAHRGERYSLRITSLGKLILTK